MKKSVLFSELGLVIIAVVTLIVIGLANTTFKSFRIDLTENNLFTITEGSKNIIRDLQRPVEFKFFFSDQFSQENPELRGLRNYAQRVQQMLKASKMTILMLK